MHDEGSLLFLLLRSGMGEPVALPSSLSFARAEAAYRLAKRYDLAHVVAQPLCGLLPADCPLAEKLQRAQLSALYRGEQLAYELSALETALTAEGIPFIPLKGAVLRQDYPQPWMRTVGDVDVLVRREELERAVACLTDRLGCEKRTEGTHDVSLFTPGGVHIELHHTLVEEGRAAQSAAVLSRVWELSRPEREGGCRYGMPDALFYVYHIAHMAKHVERGGCGVRPLLDLWLLERKPHDPAARADLLAQSGLVRFAEVCRGLVACRFRGDEPEEAQRRMEAYILDGGLYGSQSNRTAVEQSRQGGKFRYVVSRLFPPADRLSMEFPVLRRHPWLLPGCWLWRFGRLLSGGRMRRSVAELKTAKPAADSAGALMEELGL